LSHEVRGKKGCLPILPDLKYIIQETCILFIGNFVF